MSEEDNKKNKKTSFDGMPVPAITKENASHMRPFFERFGCEEGMKACDQVLQDLDKDSENTGMEPSPKEKLKWTPKDVLVVTNDGETIPESSHDLRNLMHLSSLSVLSRKVSSPQDPVRICFPGTLEQWGNLKAFQQRLGVPLPVRIDLPVVTKSQLSRSPDVLVITAAGERIPEQSIELRSWSDCLDRYFRHNALVAATDGPLPIQFPGTKKHWELLKIMRQCDPQTTTPLSINSDLKNLGVSFQGDNDPHGLFLPGLVLPESFLVDEVDTILLCFQVLGVPGGIDLCYKIKARHVLLERDTRSLYLSRDIILKCAAFLDPLSAERLCQIVAEYTRDIVVAKPLSLIESQEELVQRVAAQICPNDEARKYANKLAGQHKLAFSNLVALAARYAAPDPPLGFPLTHRRKSMAFSFVGVDESSSREFQLENWLLLPPGLDLPAGTRRLAHFTANVMVVAPTWKPCDLNVPNHRNNIYGQWNEELDASRHDNMLPHDVEVGILVGICQEDREALLSVGNRLVGESDGHDNWLPYPFGTRFTNGLPFITVTRKRAKDIIPQGYPHAAFVQNGNDTDFLCFWKMPQRDPEEDQSSSRTLESIQGICEEYCRFFPAPVPSSPLLP